MKKTLLFTLFPAVLATAALAQQADMTPPSGFGSVPDQQQPELSAVYTADNGNDAKETLQNIQETSVQQDQSVILVQNNSKLSISKAILKKLSGNTTNEDQSNFYGLNGAVVCTDGSQLSLNNVEIVTDADGSNAVFATGDNSKVYINRIKIHTYDNSSRGLDATYNGYINASNVDITTEGDHCAAFATDRGEGTVIVSKGTATTNGEGSPVIYSTGDIQVTGITGQANGSEIACIEGKNSITINKSNLTGSSTHGIMLYQSMSGDSYLGTCNFTSSDSTLTTLSSGPFFYITNTAAQINLTNTKLKSNSGILIQCSGNNSERGWGQQGANGGTLTLNTSNQKLDGNIIVDEISSAVLNFGSKTTFTGAINTDNQGKTDLNISKTATISLTGDCYINKFTDQKADFSNIKSNGYTIYYNSAESSNDYLGGKTYKLDNGGQLKPLEMTFKEVQIQEQNSFTPPVRPDEKTITGELSTEVNNKSTSLWITTEDGTRYSLSVMEQPQNNPQNPQGFPQFDKNPMTSQQPPSPPKMITKEDLAALVGKTVSLTGFVTPSGFTVTRID